MLILILVPLFLFLIESGRILADLRLWRDFLIYFAGVEGGFQSQINLCCMDFDVLRLSNFGHHGTIKWVHLEFYLSDNFFWSVISFKHKLDLELICFWPFLGLRINF